MYFKIARREYFKCSHKEKMVDFKVVTMHIGLV